MSAMYRLKAYFGMVPADEMCDYFDEHATARRSDGWADARADAAGHDDRSAPAGERPQDRWQWRAAESVRAAAAVRADEVARGLRSGGLGSGAAVHGALAVDHDGPPALARSELAPREPEPRLPERTPVLARITTLQPRSYNEARTIGERYRDGTPVIMNLTELDDAAAKRLVDFAAGLAFALRGSIDKVTSRVFLLTPPGVEVSADDARVLAERSRLFGGC